jgi:hypothetical protein
MTEWVGAQVMNEWMCTARLTEMVGCLARVDKRSMQTSVLTSIQTTPIFCAGGVWCLHMAASHVPLS